MSAYVPDVDQIVSDLKTYFATNYHVSEIREDDDIQDILEEADIGEDKGESVEDFLEGLEEEFGVAELDLEGISTISDLAESIHSEMEISSGNIKREINQDTRKVRKNAENAASASSVADEAEKPLKGSKQVAISAEDGGGADHSGKHIRRKTSTGRAGGLGS